MKKCPHSDAVGWANDSANRLLQFQRGIMHGDGKSLAMQLALSGVDAGRQYNLDATGNWVDDGFSGSMPAVESNHDCHADTQSRTTNNLNQIASVDGTDLSHDIKGNLLGYKDLAFTFDGFNRLITADGTGPDGTTTHAKYYYDALRRRLRKTNNDTTIDFVPFGSQVTEERDDSNTLLRQFVWGQYVDELVQQREYENAPDGEDSADWYPLTDLLYRSVALTDDKVCDSAAPADGTSSAGPSNPKFVEVYDTDVYGRTKTYKDPGPDGRWFSDDDTPTFHPLCRRIYTGREYDPETGLYYFNSRYYDADLGRFLSRNPIMYQGGMNLYAYCGGMPGGGTDPTGNDRMQPVSLESNLSSIDVGWRIKEGSVGWDSDTHWARVQADPLKLAQSDYAYWLPIFGHAADRLAEDDRELRAECASTGWAHELNMGFLRRDRAAKLYNVQLAGEHFTEASRRIAAVQGKQSEGAMEGIESRVSWMRMVPGGNTAYHLLEGNYKAAAGWFAFDVVCWVPWTKPLSAGARVFHSTQAMGGFEGDVLRSGAAGRIWGTRAPGAWLSSGGPSLLRMFRSGRVAPFTDTVGIIGGARELFEPVYGIGPFTGWKSWGGQVVTRAPGSLRFFGGELVPATTAELQRFWLNRVGTGAFDISARSTIYAIPKYGGVALDPPSY